MRARIRVRPWIGPGLGLLLGVTPLHGQLPRIRAEVDTTVVTVGDRITLQVSVDHPAASRVTWPDSLNLGPFEVLAARTFPPVSREDGMTSSAILTLAAFELGDLEIPSFQVDVSSEAGESTTLSTAPLGIRVNSVGLDEGGDIRDVKGPMGIPRSLARILLMALAVILAVGTAYALHRRFRRRSPGTPQALPATPPRPPHEVALEAFARLEASPLLERDEVKEFHIQGSEILRVYIEGRFGVPAMEMTTADVTGGLEGAGMESSLLEGFQSFLERCDLVKFAKHRPMAEASLAVLAMGRQLVKDTIPAARPEVETPPPAPAAMGPAPRPETPQAQPGEAAS